jgi:ABC-type nitrate/sulfonate/bicarbonate transport system substrate-binding protein
VISANGLLSSLWVSQHKDESNPFLFATKIYPSRNFRTKPNFRSIEAGRKVLLNYADEFKNLQYTSFFASTKAVAQNRPMFVRFMRAMGQAMRWTNDPANEKAVVELMMQRLKIDEATAAQTYKYLIPENKSFRLESLVDGPGMAEMVRLLFDDKLIAEKKPWESFVDPTFLPVK